MQTNQLFSTVLINQHSKVQPSICFLFFVLSVRSEFTCLWNSEQPSSNNHRLCVCFTTCNFESKQFGTLVKTTSDGVLLIDNILTLQVPFLDREYQDFKSVCNSFLCNTRSTTSNESTHFRTLVKKATDQQITSVNVQHIDSPSALS